MSPLIRSVLGLLVCASVYSQTIFETVQNGDLDKLKDLVHADASWVSTTNDDQETALFYAALGGQVEMVRYLLKQGAHVDAKNAMGETALHYAAYAGQDEVIGRLLDSGADVNAPNIEGNTPLHYTVFGDRLKTMDLLLDRGADLGRVNAYDYAPIDFADVNGRPESAARLASRGAERLEIGDLISVHLAKRIHRISYPFGDLSNIGVSIGGEGVLLVDTGCSERAIPALKRTLKELGGGDLKYIINTHLHRDHIAGNAIAGGNTLVIDYTLLDSLTEKGVLTRVSGPLAGRSGRAFGDYYTLTFNGEEIRLIPHPGIHTEADMLVHFTESRVVHTGDLLISQSFPSVRQKSDEYLAFLDILGHAFPAETIFLCGHGKEFSLQDVRDYRNMLASVSDIVRRHLARGEGKKEIRASGELDVFSEWGEFIPILNTEYWMNAVLNTYREEGQ